MGKMTKPLALVLTLALTLGCFAGCKKTPDENQGEVPEGKADYTYRDYITQPAVTWNPHTWQTQADYAILQYLETPLVAAGVKDSEKGVHQWVYKAAQSVTDVTKENTGDLTKYKVTLPAGQAAESIESGYVFEIKLNPDLRWQNGREIAADAYIYSMETLLSPAKQNYRASRYYSGATAVAGGFDYYNALTKYLYISMPYGKIPAGETVYMDVWALCNAKNYKNSNGKACPQYIANDDTAIYYSEDGSKVISGKILWATYGGGINNGQHPAYVYRENPGYNQDYIQTYDATVGCYKVDEYTIRYVTQNQTDMDTFLDACRTNWLVYQDLYAPNYATSLETTMSYGPYKLESLEKGSRAVLVQNENYYLYQKQENGSLYAETDYTVDGESVQAYQTTKIVIDVMSDEQAKEAFLKGELSRWTPAAADMADYATSERLQLAKTTETLALFFNTDAKLLQKLDAKGNKNAAVLSNSNFRKAISMAIDRENWVSATSGYTPASYLLSSAYYYDIYNNPNSTYRGTQQAMQAMCDLYGVKWVDGSAYGTLEEAYASITGYRPEEAAELMKTACQELVKAGLYTAGEEIKIQVACSDGVLTAAHEAQVNLLNQYLNTAMANSGFGKLILVAVGQIPDYESKVAEGSYAIGLSAAGGDPLAPFTGMQAYCDTDANRVAELGCWDPSAEKLTIQIEGKKVTKTWQEWSRSMTGDGVYANATVGVKLQILSTMEKELLAKYYRIPLAEVCAASIQSYQIRNYGENYNILYGFGGVELMTYDYTDAQWTAYIAKSGGQLDYK